jgi:hypothetical protein
MSVGLRVHCTRRHRGECRAAYLRNISAGGAEGRVSCLGAGRRQDVQICRKGHRSGLREEARCRQGSARLARSRKAAGIHAGGPLLVDHHRRRDQRGNRDHRRRRGGLAPSARRAVVERAGRAQICAHPCAAARDEHARLLCHAALLRRSGCDARATGKCGHRQGRDLGHQIRCARSCRQDHLPHRPAGNKEEHRSARSAGQGRSDPDARGIPQGRPRRRQSAPRHALVRRSRRRVAGSRSGARGPPGRGRQGLRSAVRAGLREERNRRADCRLGGGGRPLRHPRQPGDRHPEAFVRQCHRGTDPGAVRYRVAGRARCAGIPRRPQGQAQPGGSARADRDRRVARCHPEKPAGKAYGRPRRARQSLAPRARYRQAWARCGGRNQVSRRAAPVLWAQTRGRSDGRAGVAAGHRGTRPGNPAAGARRCGAAVAGRGGGGSRRSTGRRPL